ncbi:hypothetical protein SDC9_151862 [bioreactor metagenome]|uniref:Uncharacterized protein n=1 Tax=bioreactor metagenome TaxID=1076179 RepID=A0A645ERF2_9ZZZZ
MAKDHAEQRVNHQPAKPGLNAIPAARHQCAQHGRQFGAARAERCAGQHRIGNAVFGARMSDQQHGQQHDHVGEEHRHHRLHGGHAAFDQTGRQRVGGDAHHHADPQRREVVPAPGALRQRRRR